MTENTMIHTGFSAESTIWDVAEGVDLSGRRAIVTGASSGIGIETARALAANGAEVSSPYETQRRRADRCRYPRHDQQPGRRRRQT
jgi:hypothetical protein